MPSTNRPERNGRIPLIPDRDDPPSGCRAIRALLFVLAAVGLSARALTGFFLSDDWVLLYGVDRGGPLGVWSGRGSMFFRPLVSLSLFADHRIFGLNPLGFHLTNAVLHGLCSWQVFEIAGRLLRGLEAPATRRRELQLAAGLAFLTLPVHSEAVSWISGRADLVATLLGILSLRLYLKERGAGRAVPVGALFLLMAGLLAKESLVVVPLLALAFEACAFRAGQRGGERAPLRLGAPGSLVALLPVYLLLRRVAIGSLVGGYGSDVHLNFLSLRPVKGLLFACARLYTPPMPILWRILQAPATALPKAVFICGLLVGVAVACAWVIRRWLARSARRLPSISGWLGVAFLVSLLPVLTLRSGWVLVGTMGERLYYLPSVFGAILFPCVMHALFPGTRGFRAATLVVVLFWGFSLERSTEAWRTAAGIAEGLVESTADLQPAGTLFVLNLPDSMLEGPYIFRNGFPEALALQGVRGLDRRTSILTLSSPSGSMDGASVVEETPGVYAVGLFDREGVSWPGSDEGLVTGAYEISPDPGPKRSELLERLGAREHFRSYRIRLKTLDCDDGVVYYSRGRLRPAPSSRCAPPLPPA